MPKEYIRTSDYDLPRKAVSTEDGSTVDHADYTAARVSWDRGSELVSMALVDLKADPDGFNADRYLNLSRHGINTMIRTLRRARDAAYGADA